MRILLDSNILLRIVEPGHPHNAVASDALDLLKRRGHDALIVPQALYEFWSVATRPVVNHGLGWTPAEAHREIRSFQRLFGFLRDERAVFPLWEQLVFSLQVKGKPSHDARFVAAMMRHSLTHLLTFNTGDFARYAITAMSPMDVVASGASF